MRTAFIKYLGCTFLFALLLIPSIAQVVFTTKISSKIIGKNELLEVNYEALEGAIENFSEPRFPGWQLVGGPNLSSSTIITNGKRTSSMSYAFLLKPKETGNLIVPGAKAVIDGKQYSSNSMTVQVTGNKRNYAPPSNTPDPLLPPPVFPIQENPYEENDAFFISENEDILTKTKNNLFVLVEVSKKTCYPGEAIKATYKLYSRVNMDAHITRRPSFSGFSSIDLPDPITSEYEIQTHNGKTFKVYLIRSVQLYPLQPGFQTLQPVEIESTVQYRKHENNIQLDPFGSPAVVNYTYLVKSEPVSVNVLPFPEENKPADFYGVTGNFSIEANTGYNEYAKKEAGVLRVTITGSGNWGMLPQPEIKWPGSTDVFEAGISEKLDSQSIPISGKRIYEFPFSANKEGNFLIAPVTLSYFDATEKKYVTASSKPITVRIRNTFKPLHSQAAVIVKNSTTDGTVIFTRIVQVVFPVAAVLLLGWFFLSYRNKRDADKKAKILKASYDATSFRHSQKSTTRYRKLIAVNDFSKYKSWLTANQKSELPNNEDVIIEKSKLINEHAGFEPVTSREYFQVAKTNLLHLLKKHFNIDEQPVYLTKNALQQHGLNPGEINKIASVLALCEKHIYSPFDESFDKKNCDDLVQEITMIFSSREKRDLT